MVMRISVEIIIEKLLLKVNDDSTKAVDMTDDFAVADEASSEV